MMGLQIELEEAVKAISQVSSSLSLKSGCELFQRYVTRTYLDIPVRIIIYIPLYNIYVLSRIWFLSLHNDDKVFFFFYYIWRTPS